MQGWRDLGVGGQGMLQKGDHSCHDGGCSGGLGVCRVVQTGGQGYQGSCRRMAQLCPWVATHVPVTEHWPDWERQCRQGAVSLNCLLQGKSLVTRFLSVRFHVACIHESLKMIV